MTTWQAVRKMIGALALGAAIGLGLSLGLGMLSARAEAIGVLALCAVGLAYTAHTLRWLRRQDRELRSLQEKLAAYDDGGQPDD